MLSLYSYTAPCVCGHVLELLAAYPDKNAVLAEYPYLEDGDLQQALHYVPATVDVSR